MPKKGIIALVLSVFSIFLIKECMSRFPLSAGQENRQNRPPEAGQTADTIEVPMDYPGAVQSNPPAPAAGRPGPAARRPRNVAPKPVKTSPLAPVPAPDTAQLRSQQQTEKDLLNAVLEKNATNTNTVLSGSNQGYPSDKSDPFATGSGLSGRKLLSRVVPQDDSQAEGKVSVRICVNALGDVISAEVTQRGTTTTDTGLRNKSLAAVQNWKFEPRPGLETQCGTVTFNYVLK